MRARARPRDCVVAAMTVLFADAPKPSLVLAGINDKRNVAEDIAYSGTMAIAREAAFFGVPAIALSRVEDALDGRCRPRFAAPPAAMRCGDTAPTGRSNGHWLSVNLPASLPAPLAQARIGRDKIGGASEILHASDERIDYRLRRGRPGTTISG